MKDSRSSNVVGTSTPRSVASSAHSTGAAERRRDSDGRGGGEGNSGGSSNGRVRAVERPPPSRSSSVMQFARPPFVFAPADRSTSLPPAQMNGCVNAVLSDHIMMTTAWSFLQDSHSFNVQPSNESELIALKQEIYICTTTSFILDLSTCGLSPASHIHLMDT